MNWILLIIAGLFEVAFATCLGKAQEATGSEVVFWYAGFVTFLAISMLLLVKVTQTIPVGTSYAVWTGIGAVGTALVGILIFNEPATFFEIVLYNNINCLYSWTKNGFAVIERVQ